MRTLLLALIVLLAACEVPAPPKTADATPAVPAVSISDAISGNSVYLLDAPWTDQSDAPASLQSFVGRPVVMTFVYTHCGATCPLLVHHMKGIERALSDEAKAQTAFVLVSLDPDRDTPEQLAKFAKAHGLDPTQWTLLRGAREDVRALAASMSVGYRSQSDGQIVHANLLTILNQQGEVVEQVPGSGSPDEAVALLDSLVAEAR